MGMMKLEMKLIFVSLGITVIDFLRLNLVDMFGKTMITMGIWWENILESNDFLFRLAFLFGLFLNAKVGK